MSRLENSEDIDFRLLSEFNDPAEIVKNSEALEAFFRIKKYALKKESTQSALKLSERYHFPFVVVQILENQYEEIKRKVNEQEKNSELAVIDEKLIFISSVAIEIIQGFSHVCTRFSELILDANGVSALFKFLRFEKLVSLYVELAETEESNKSVVFDLLEQILRGSVGCLVNLSKIYSSCKYKFKKKEENMMQILPKLCSKLNNFIDFGLAIYIVLASISDDQELETLACAKRIAKLLSNLIGEMCSSLEANKGSVNRLPIRVYQEDIELQNVCAILVNKVMWHLTELINALYNMAVNDQIKHEIYYENDMRKHLRSLICNGNRSEQESGIKMLWQLCFDSRVARDVCEDLALIKRIESLKRTSDSSRFKVTCENMLWTLGASSEKNSEKTGEMMRRQAEKSKKHIMISYNKHSRELCLRVKKELEEVGYTIWIDVENIHGSSLESMAKAIEDSCCVLMCMTESYKQSSNCRAEAEYSFQLNKPIIPLIMQRDYMPDGWLGIVLGSKIYINFFKYDFEICMDRLKSELSNFLCITAAVAALTGEKLKNNSIKEQVSSKEPEALNWRETEVEQWLIKTEIHADIRNNVFPCDGKLLNQMHLMLSEAPDYFYKSVANIDFQHKSAYSLSDDTRIRTKDVALFAYELKMLFRK